MSIDAAAVRRGCELAGRVAPWLASGNNSDAAALLALLRDYCLALLARDEWHRRSARELASRVVGLEALVASLSERCHAQSLLLSRAAERTATRAAEGGAP